MKHNLNNWMQYNEISPNPMKFAPLEELRNQTVFLKLTFKEFYTGRSASGVLFEDSEGLVYKMQMKDFERMLQKGWVFQLISNKNYPNHYNGTSGEFKIKGRGGYWFIEMVLPND